jgi:hypothetical protein
MGGRHISLTSLGHFIEHAIIYSTFKESRLFVTSSRTVHNHRLICMAAIMRRAIILHAFIRFDYCVLNKTNCKSVEVICATSDGYLQITQVIVCSTGASDGLHLLCALLIHTLYSMQEKVQVEFTYYTIYVTITIS